MENPLFSETPIFYHSSIISCFLTLNPWVFSNHHLHPPPALWLRRKRSDLAVWRIDRTNEPTNQRTKQTKIANLKIPWKLEDEFNLIHSPRNLACGTQSHEGLEDVFFFFPNGEISGSMLVFRCVSFLGRFSLLFRGANYFWLNPPHLAADFARLGERLKSPQWGKNIHDFDG